MASSLPKPRLAAHSAGDPFDMSLNRLHRAKKDSSSFSCTAAVILGLIVFVLLSSVPTRAQAPFPRGPYHYPPHSAQEKRSLLEARGAYMWAFNEIWLRDGDNPNIRPARKEVTLNSPAFGIYGETFFMSDLAGRIQAWINVPIDQRNDFIFDGLALAWDTQARYVAADLSVVYHFGLGGTPYQAGIVGGYRYNDFDYRSVRNANPAGTFRDHMSVHIPYLGVHYAHRGFVGGLVRLDLIWSPLTLARYEGIENRLQTPLKQIVGTSITGFWFDSYLGWSTPVGEKILAGVFAQYSYLELSGGAKVEAGVSSTRFSMDSRHHLIFSGLTLSYAF